MNTDENRRFCTLWVKTQTEWYIFPIQGINKIAHILLSYLYSRAGMRCSKTTAIKAKEGINV